MDDFLVKKRKLLSIKNKLLRMPNDIRKARAVDGYANLFAYYKEVCNLDDNKCTELDLDNDLINKYDYHVVKKTQKKLSEICRLAPYLYQRYNKLINLYKENGFCSFEFSVMGKVNQKDIFKDLEEFLNLLGKDVCLLYNKMISENNIFVAEDYDLLGVSMNAISVDNPCIIVASSEKYFDFYVTLLHELGHCYQFYLQRNHTHFETFNPFTELTSTLFENLFCEFLKSKNKYKKNILDYELEDHIYFLNTISSSKILCKLMMDRDIFNVDAHNLTYETTSSYEDLIYDMTNDCGYIMGNKIDFALTEFHYSIGSILAKYFLKRIKEDYKVAMKEYKDFICTVDDYPLKEIFDKYFDMNLLENDIKTFIKSYRNR